MDPAPWQRKERKQQRIYRLEICEDGLKIPYISTRYTRLWSLRTFAKNTTSSRSHGLYATVKDTSSNSQQSFDVMHWFPNTARTWTCSGQMWPKMAEGSTGHTGHSIMGKATATAAQAAEWAKKNGATELFISLAETFWKIAQAAGVNPVVAYAQSAKETGYGHFKGVLDASFKNPCGMKTKSGGANNDPNAHQRFSTWEEGIQAQIDHLALYAELRIPESRNAGSETLPIPKAQHLP